MTERKSLLEQALDVCLYAPVGLAIAVTEELPELIDKGRARVNSQLTMARMVGSFAVAQGQREAERVVKQATGLVGDGGQPAPSAVETTEPGDVESGLSDAGPSPADGDWPAAGPTGWAADQAASPDTGSPAQIESDSGPAASASPQPQPETGRGGVVDAPQPPAGDVGALAIPGYGALSASQVVQRLAGLAADELEAVRVYEAATRGRKTILNRIAQLQAPGAG